MISCARMWVKKESKSTSFWSAGFSTSFEIGVSVDLNFASWTFFSITRLEPRWLMMRSSFGRL
ncbi:hypothetical protein D3C86_2178170 [compost metagenome]